MYGGATQNYILTDSQLLVVQRFEQLQGGERIRISDVRISFTVHTKIMTTNASEHKATKQQPWYAIRTFNCQEQKVSRFLTENELVHFIPMTYAKDYTEDEKPQKTLVPAVHNLLFIQKKGSQRAMTRLLKECIIPISIFRNPGSQTFCEISERDMVELRMLCDPQFKTSVFMTQTEAEAMVGKDVRVIAGPFKGSIGRLVRKHKQYYFLKAFIGMGVMVRISRWYCEPID